MPRNARCVLPGLPYHVTQRGTNRQEVFFINSDRELYLRLLSRNLRSCHCRLLAYTLMKNHIHAVVVPDRAESLGVLFRRVHGAYAQYINTRKGRTGHLWQGRFYSCAFSERHLAVALRYVENNPIRVGIVERPEDYRWSSAAVHLKGTPDRFGILDESFFERAGGVESWREIHATPESEEEVEQLRRCTHAGRPCGDEAFVARMEEMFGRVWGSGKAVKTAKE